MLFRSKEALDQVVAALHTLEGMQEDMEDLRQRAAAPELMGEGIPVEVHMQSIRAGLKRLSEDRDRTRLKKNQLSDRILGIAAD